MNWTVVCHMFQSSLQLSTEYQEVWEESIQCLSLLVQLYGGEGQDCLSPSCLQSFSHLLRTHMNSENPRIQRTALRIIKRLVSRSHRSIWCNISKFVLWQERILGPLRDNKIITRHRLAHTLTLTDSYWAPTFPNNVQFLQDETDRRCKTDWGGKKCWVVSSCQYLVKSLSNFVG